MALSIGQQLGKKQGNNVDSTSASFGATPSAGSTIVVTISGWRTFPDGGFNVSGATAVTDNQGNTYNLTVQSNLSSTNDYRSCILHAYNIVAAGTFTITVDPTGVGNYFTWTATEVIGATTTDPKDATQSAVGTSATPNTGTTATLAQADEIVFAAMTFADNRASCTVDVAVPVWNELYEELSSTICAGEADYRIVSATTAQSVGWTLAVGTSVFTACIATFKQAAVVVASNIVKLAGSAFRLAGNGGGLVG